MSTNNTKKFKLFLIQKVLPEQFCWHQQNWQPSDLILFVDLNKSIFRQIIYFVTGRHQRRSVRYFLVPEQTKKPQA
nr:MAG TPA: hypothetical protein [Caudoviricetes sp.]